MSVKTLIIAFSLLFSASGAYSLSGSENEELDLLSLSETCYYFVETTLDRAVFRNNRVSLSYLISNVVPAGCNRRIDVLNQFNEAVKADGRYADAKLARVVLGPYSSRQDALRKHRRHIGDYLSNNHVVTDFSFRYYRD